MLHAIIMAGGAGTRFWPASRADRPKQLLNLAGERTMIQSAVDRLNGLVDDERVLVVTNERLLAPIARQLPQLPPSALVGEPCKRDTAPCIGLAAALVSRRDDDAVMLVMPADHVIETDQQFQSAVRQAVDIVEQNPQRMVTFGIRPTYAAVTFGYIERGEALPAADGGSPVYRVNRFREKPQAPQAEEFFQSGGFYWNAGIFVWKASTILSALAQFEPDMHAHLQAIAAALDGDDYEAVLRREFEAIEGKSIDYAVMERYEDVAVIEAPFAWDDLGAWRSLSRTRGADADGNTIIGRHLGLRTSDSIVRTEDDHLIVTLGLKNCIVVHTPDATLVAGKDDEEAIRDVVKALREKGWEQYL